MALPLFCNNAKHVPECTRAFGRMMAKCLVGIAWRIYKAVFFMQEMYEGTCGDACARRRAGMQLIDSKRLCTIHRIAHEQGTSMGQIYLVRHGQASFGKANYDQLSELGIEQARLLGQWFASCGVHIDKVVTGDMQRHRQTAEACMAMLPPEALPDAEWQT